ncbi:MAG: hypothetical protein GXP16_14130 [Gammaproteobacteria bacterium]|nr:hypothetical protein [Gammaproteobacteria bacterium]
MEQNQQGLIDLLEVFHARQLRDDILGQLRRLRSSTQQLPMVEPGRKQEIRRYYEALLLTVAELLHQLGDDDIPH